jgi:hypothetical protein
MISLRQHACALTILTDTNDTRSLFRRIVEYALPDFVVYMGAVMIRFYRSTCRLMRVGMKGVQVCADALRRREVLVAIST